jgi:hypothetical protein
VEQSVINNIYGGNVLIASHADNFSQIAQTHITQSDLPGLLSALSELGITKEGIQALEHGMTADKSAGQATIGPKTKGWLAEIGKYIAKQGAKAGFEVAKQTATKWILQHYGLGV